MALIAGEISTINGPSILLPRRAAVARIAVPDWPALNDAEGCQRLGGLLCDALLLESGHPLRAICGQDGARQDTHSGTRFLAELFCRLALHLQQVAGHPVVRCRSVLQTENPQPLTVWETMLPRTGRAAGLSAAKLIEAAAGPEGEARSALDFDMAVAEVGAVSQAVGNSVIEVLLAAAYRRGIPWQMLDPVWPMLAFGQGSGTKRLMSTMSEAEGHISTLFTQDKMLSLQVLRESGFPVPDHHLVPSEEAAVAAAERLGYPVVVKPLDQMRSRGVSVNLRDPEAVRKAYQKAAAISRAILVESQLPGLPFRILVIGGQARAAMQRSRPTVLGDGSSNIEALIEKTNRERATTALKTAHGPRRINLENFVEELEPSLAEQGLKPDSIPEEGRLVHLAFKGETGRGGENLDVTEAVHPDNLAMAEAVAGIFELSVMGLDFMTEDITRSYKEVNCGINEVNAEPAFSLHMSATSTPRDVVTPFLDLEFGRRGNGRIPISCTLASADDAGFDLLAKALGFLSQEIGLAAGDSLARVGRFHLPEGESGRRPAARILADSRVDSALVALAPGDFASGLAFDRCTACHLPSPPVGDRDAVMVQQARLMAEEIAEAVILTAADFSAWAEWMDFSKCRLVIVSKDGSVPGEQENEPPLPNGAAVIRLQTAPALTLLYEHDNHVDCLARLDHEVDFADAPLDGLLLATANLVALGRHPRDIGRAITEAWHRRRERSPQSSTQ